MRTMLSIGTRWLVNHKRRYILCIFVIALSVACMVLFYSVGSGVRKSVVRYSSASALYRNIMIDRTETDAQDSSGMDTDGGKSFEDIAEAIGAMEMRVEHPAVCRLLGIDRESGQEDARIVMLDTGHNLLLDSEKEAYKAAVGQSTPEITGSLFTGRNVHEAVVTDAFLARNGIGPDSAIGMVLYIGNAEENAVPYTITGVIDSLLGSVVEFYKNDIYINAAAHDRGQGTELKVTYCMKDTEAAEKAIITLQQLGYHPDTQYREVYYAIATRNGIEKGAFFVGLALLLGSMFNLVNTLCRTFAENMSIIAIMETLGYTKKRTAMLSVWCGFWVSTLGCLLGIALSLGMSRFMDSVLAYIGKASLLSRDAFRIDTGFIPVCFGCAVCMGIAFSLICFVATQRRAIIERIKQ